MTSGHRLFRPPAEADSLIIRVADGCPHNQCTFCGMYKGVRYRGRPESELMQELAAAKQECPEARRIFLADGDVMRLPFVELQSRLDSICRDFPRVGRISLYANANSILAKTAEQLRRLKALKLHTLYMGLESGDEPTLLAVHKPETAAQMVDAVQLAQTCGLRMSVMFLVGLSGRERTREHAGATARIINQMQPRLLSALRLVPIPGTPLHRDAQRGRFRQLTEHQAIEELRDTISQLELHGTVFRANHSSNILPLEGRLPKDRDRLLNELDSLLKLGVLDTETPGPMPLYL